MDRTDQEFFVAVFAQDWGDHFMCHGPARRLRDEAAHAGECGKAMGGIADDAAFADGLTASVAMSNTATAMERKVRLYIAERIRDLVVRLKPDPTTM